MKIIIGMTFLFFCNTDVNFTKPGKLILKTYTIAKVLSIISNI